jgi:hypothetical protein
LLALATGEESYKEHKDCEPMQLAGLCFLCPFRCRSKRFP